MEGELTIFCNFTPNTPGGIYYAPSPTSKGAEFNTLLLSQFMDEAQANNRQLYQRQGKTFKIYEEYIEIAEGSGINKINAPFSITYVAISTGYKIIFYFVDRVQLVTAGIRLYTRLDNWATYIGESIITNCDFKRSNVQLNPYDDELYLTEFHSPYNAAKKQYLPLLQTNLDSLRIVAVIIHDTYKDINSSIQIITVYEFNPHDIANERATASNPNPPVLKTDIEQLINLISNLYQVRGSTGTGKAEVKHLYITPFSFEKKTAAQNFDSILNGSSKQVEGFELTQNINDFNITLSTGDLDFSPKVDTIEARDYLGCEMYIGTKYNGLKLPAFVGVYGIIFRIECKADKLTFSVISGNEQRDITSAFELVTVANSGSLTSQESAAKWLGVIANTAGGIAQITAGGAGIVSGGLQIASTLASLQNQNNGTYIGGGDGLTTFEDVFNNPPNIGKNGYIFLAIAAGSFYFNSDDRAERVKMAGAICEYKYPFPAQNLWDYISAKPYILKQTSYIVIACSASVDNIPYSAGDEIANILESGVRLKIINNLENG